MILIECMDQYLYIRKDFKAVQSTKVSTFGLFWYHEPGISPFVSTLISQKLIKQV